MEKKFLVLLSIFLFWGCSNFSVHHDEATLAFFSGKKTFAWLAEGVPGDDIRVNNPTIRKLVHSSVEQKLEKKGYVMVAEEDADFLVAWFGSIDEVVKDIHISAFYRPYGYGTLVGNEPDYVEGGMAKKVFEIGTLIIDIVDPQSKAVFWRDTATNAISKKMSNQELSKYIDLSVSKILEGVPVADH